MKHEQITMQELLNLRPSKQPKTEVDKVKDWVSKNRSGLMSAFIKSMRMQKINQTIYWGAVLLLGGQNPWYVSRRTVISSAEDGNDLDVFEYVVRNHTERGFEVPTILKQAVAVCHAKNWWNSKYGRRSMRLMFKSSKVKTPVSSSWSECLEQLKMYLMTEGDENFVHSMNLVETMGDMDKYFDMGDYLTFLCELLEERFKETGDKRYVRMAHVTEEASHEVAKYNDWNWSFVTTYMIHSGFCEPTDLSHLDDFDERIEKILAVAKDDLEAGRVKLQPWMFDGMHASNKEICPWKDRRFAGTNQGFYNMILMFKHNGRVDPRDQAALESVAVPPKGLVLGNEHIEDIT